MNCTLLPIERKYPDFEILEIECARHSVTGTEPIHFTAETMKEYKAEIERLAREGYCELTFEIQQPERRPTFVRFHMSELFN